MDTQTQLPSDVTRILDEVAVGDRSAVKRLLETVYQDLRELADSFFRKERNDHTLQPTALVHEAYLRMMEGEPRAYESRVHFFRAAAVVMRHLLTEHARTRGRLKRGGNLEKVQLQEAVAAFDGPDLDLLALDEALTRLAAFDPRQAQIVELRFFAGLTVNEVAETLEVSKRTVEDDWSTAKAWLWREMNR